MYCIRLPGITSPSPTQLRNVLCTDSVRRSVPEGAEPTVRRSSLQTTPKEVPLRVHFPPESVLTSVTVIPPPPDKNSPLRSLKRVLCCCLCCSRPSSWYLSITSTVENMVHSSWRRCHRCIRTGKETRAKFPRRRRQRTGLPDGMEGGYGLDLSSERRTYNAIVQYSRKIYH